MAHLPETIVQRIQMQSAGNPFFAEELAHSVSTQEETARTVHGRPVNPLPETIAAAIDRRIGKLSWVCQQLLSKAVVLGVSFEFNQLRLMNIGTSEDTLLDLLEEALATGVLIEEGTGAHITYDFWHPLIVSHLYERLSAARRAYLHRQAAEALRQIYQGHEEEGAATITHHLLKGGGASVQTAHFAQLAGDHDYALSAYSGAQRHYQLAIAQMEEMPEQLLMSAQEERLRLAYLLERVGACMTVQGDYEQALHLYERVLTLRSYQRQYVSQASYQQEAQVQALLWYLIGRLWNFTASYARVQECYERGVTILLDAGITSGPVMACLYLQHSNQYFIEGNYDEARRIVNEALQMSEKALQQKADLIDDPSLSVDIRRTIEGNPLEVGRAHELLGIIAAQAGQFSEGLPHIHMALEIFEQHDFVRPMASVSSNLGVMYITKAEYAPARACFTRALELAERVGDVRMMSIVSRNLGEVAFLVGDLAEATEYNQHSVVLLERLNARDQLIWSYLALALSLHDQGKLQASWKTALRALWLSRIIKSAPAIGACLVVLAAVRLTGLELEQREGRGIERITLKRLQRTEATLQRALSIDGLTGDDVITGRVVLARVLLMYGKLDEAQQSVLRMLEEMFLQQNNHMLTHVQRLLGCILVAQGREEEAEVYFQQALQTAREYTMRLEYARALYHYGNALLKRSVPRDVTYRQGMRYLQEAHDIFVACDAVIDLEKVRQTLEPMDFDNQAR